MKWIAPGIGAGRDPRPGGFEMHRDRMLRCDATSRRERLVVLAVLLILLALIIGGIGLIVKGLLWLLLLALILFVAGALFGLMRGARRGTA